MTGFVRNLGFLPFHNLSSSVEQFLGWSSLDGLLMPMEDCPQLSSPISFVASLALSHLLLHTSAHFLSWDLQWVLLSIHFSWYLTYLVIIIKLKLCQPFLICILVIEYVGINKRTLVGNLGLALALTLSGCYQPWLAQYLGHWKTFNWVIYGQMISVIAVPFILPESCRWLISKGNKKKTINILKRIARQNKKDVPEYIWKQVECLCDHQNNQK